MRRVLELSLPRWLPSEALVAQGIPAGRRVGFAKRPWSRTLDLERLVSRRSGLNRSAFCEAFPSWRSGDVSACHANRLTEGDLASPFPKSGLRSLSSPSTVGPEACAPLEVRAFSSSLGQARSRAVGRALARTTLALTASVTRAAPRARPERIRASLGPPAALGWVHLRTEVGEPTSRTASGTSPVAGRSRLPCSSRWAPAGVRGRKLRPEHPSSLLPNRTEAETPSEESVELPSRNLSRACARTPQSSGAEPVGSPVRIASRRTPREERPRARVRGAIRRMRARRAVLGNPAGLPGEPEGRAPGDRECLLGPVRIPSRRALGTVRVGPR